MPAPTRPLSPAPTTTPQPTPAPSPIPASSMQPPQPPTLASRYASVLDKIDRAARRAGRKSSDVLLVAVTKNAAPEQLRELVQLGHRDFGENRVQVLQQHAAIVDEFLARQRMLPSARKPASESPLLASSALAEVKPARGAAAPASTTPVRWHMIGHLQRNKAKKIIDMVRLVQSVDSLRIAEELQHIALKKDRPIEVLMQVNVAGEEQKFGCPLPAAIRLAEQIGTMINVHLRGLMCMAPHAENPEDARPTFSRCRELFEEMQRLRITTDAPFNILSMGMSDDYEVAIEEGANLIRVGSAIFGEAPAGAEHPEQPEPDAPGEGYPDDAEGESSTDEH